MWFWPSSQAFGLGTDVEEVFRDADVNIFYIFWYVVDVLSSGMHAHKCRNTGHPEIDFFQNEVRSKND